MIWLKIRKCPTVFVNLLYSCPKVRSTMNNFASLVQPLPPGAGSSTACATVPKVDLIAPSLSHSSSVVIGLGLFEESVAEGRTIAPGVYTKLRSLYEYNPPPAQGTGTGTARNACFLDGCQNGFRALRYCSLAAIRLRTLLSYASSAIVTFFVSFCLLYS